MLVKPSHIIKMICKLYEQNWLIINMNIIRLMLKKFDDTE